MRIGINPTLTSAPERIAEDVAAAVALGLDGFWTNQHPGGWDPLVLLAATGRVAAGTGLELGTAIVPTFPRHPVVVAAEALTVQASTGAPLTLGLGPSHRWLMTDQYGLPYDAPAAHSREYLTIVRGLLRGDHVRHRGRFFTVDTRLDVAAGASAPSLLLSALGPRMLAVAGDLADGVVAVFVLPAFMADTLVPALPDGARIVVQVLAGVTADPEGLRARVALDFAAVESMPAYRRVLDQAGLRGPAETVLVGSEEEVARGLAAFADAGATDVLVSTIGPEPDRTLRVAVTVRDRTAGSRPPR